MASTSVELRKAENRVWVQEARCQDEEEEMMEQKEKGAAGKLEMISNSGDCSVHYLDRLILLCICYCV